MEIPGIVRQANPRKQNTDIPIILPHEKVFPIQIGTELFRLSGASLSSDGLSPFHFPSINPLFADIINYSSLHDF